MPDIVLLGDINVDIIALLTAYPALGGESVATAVEYHTGGGVVSSAFALANMDVDVGVIGRIGTDALATRVISDLEQAGVDISQVQIDKTVSTGLVYVAVTPDGERTMFSARGANVFTEPTVGLDDYFARARWYHFSGYALLAEPQHTTAINGLESARRHLCRVSLDPGPEAALHYQQQIKALLPKVDIFFPNENELMLMAEGKNHEDAIQALLQCGAGAVALKRGSAGCIIAYSDQYYEIPAFEVSVKDTTGAGDSFNAGIALGRMVGLSWPAAGVLGNALGAIAVSKRGSGAGSVNRKGVEGLITQDQFKPQWMGWQAALEEVLAWL